MGICETKNNFNKEAENKANTQTNLVNNSSINEIFKKNEKVLLN